jgi:hypothetical protein
MKPMMHYEHLEQAIADLKADNERLRRALEDCVFELEANNKSGWFQPVISRARAALKGE